MDSQLTLIDLDAPLQDQARAMDAACRSTGFFRVPLAAVDRSVADAAWQAAAAFFALPEAQKRQIEFPEPGYPYGYSPFGYEALANSVAGHNGAPPDLKESLSVGPDCVNGQSGERDGADVWSSSPSLWPDRPEQLRSAFEQYYRALTGLAEHLMGVMAVALDLPQDYFSTLIDQPITSMRALHYPKLATTSYRALRAGAHSDYGTLTILRNDHVPGLQIQDLRGAWVPVDPDPDTFVVNLGDSIAQWTNDRWRSTMHRVTGVDASARQSFAFFHMANWDAMIECLPSCLEPGEQPKYPPAQAGPWLKEKFQSTVPS